MSATVELNTNELLSYQPRLVNVSAIWGEYHPNSTPPYDAKSGFHQAFDCVRYSCVQTFSGEVVQNEFTESITNVYYDPNVEAIERGSAQNRTWTIRVPQSELLADAEPTFVVGGGAV